jgi:molybdenum cofactor guanylyltransferase
MNIAPEPMPMHGFVLAGGASRRMGRDKALIEFEGRPLIAWAVDRLKQVCPHVTICRNRPDLRCFAEVVPDLAGVSGPAAGVGGGLAVCREDWALFTPVDVPLVPADLLRRWARRVLDEGLQGSILRAGGREHPVFCLLRSDLAPLYRTAAEAAGGRLTRIWQRMEQSGPGIAAVHDAEDFVDRAKALEVANWFANLNTEDDLRVAAGAFHAG